MASTTSANASGASRQESGPLSSWQWTWEGRPPNACIRRSKTLASAAPSYSWRSQGRATLGTDVR
eukprot:4060149-Lingulodinium_polyedra.AAC.1